MKKIYVVVLTTLFILSTSLGWSQKTWEGPIVGGSWTEPSFWSGGTVPVSTDVVVFETGITGTITNVPTMSIAGLIIEAGNVTFTSTGGAKTLTITNGAAAIDFSIVAGSTLTLSSLVNITLNNGTGIDSTKASIGGTFILNGIYNSSGSNLVTNVLGTGVIQVNTSGAATSNHAAKFRFASGANYIHARNAGVLPIASWDKDSKASITGIIDTAPGGLTAAQSFGDFEWNNSQTEDVNLNGGLKNIKGDFDIIKTSADDTRHALILTGATSHILNIGGDLHLEESGVATTTVYFTHGGNGNASINVKGIYNHESGELVFAFPDGDNNAGIATLTLDSNFLQAGGDIDFTSGVADESGTAGQKGRLIIKGNFSQTGGTIRTTTTNPEIPNGLITFNKAGLQTFNASTPTNITYVNYTVASGSILQLASNLRITRDSVSTVPNWVGKFTVNSGGTLDASTFVIQSQVLPDLEAPGGAVANFNLLAGGKFITSNADGVAGSVDTTDNLLASFSSGADYEFRGASTGVFVTTPTANTFRNLIVNRSGSLLLDMPVTITIQLNLMNGLINTTTTNLLTIGPSGSATPATNVSFVNGPLAKRGTTAFTFPVGKSGAGFRNIGITTPSGGITTFRAEFFRAEPPAGTLAPTLTRVSSCEYWDLSRTAGTGIARVVLSWETASNCGGAYVTDPTTLRVAHLVNSVWEDEGRLSSTGNNAAGTITSNDIVTTFSPFALGSSSASNPLPVVFADVKAYEKDNGVQVEWSNLTEIDVAVYTIERSANGTDFTAVGQQLPTSNQNDRASYTYFDATPGVGTNFYRIKAEETTGKIVYSSVLSVNLDRSGENLRLYPNPVTNNQVTITLSNIKRGLYTVRVVNTAGQDVFRQLITSQGQTITQHLNLPSVKPGTYHMVITGDGYRENKKFIIR